MAGRRDRAWGYRLERAAESTDGTEVTEFFAMPATLVNRVYWILGGPARLRTNLADMRATLERIKAVVEQEPG